MSSLVPDALTKNFHTAGFFSCALYRVSAKKGQMSQPPTFTVKSRFGSGPGLAGMVLLSILPSRAFAGMPTVDLTDIAAARLETLSFFVVAYLALTWLFKVCWNVLREAFPALPLLNLKKALAFTIVSGLFFWVVLTMISGARELMTPGAWERSGHTYKLRGPKEEPQVWLDAARVKALEHLRAALWDHAKAHRGEFPSNRFEATIPDEVWKGISPDGSFLAYFGDLKVDSGPWIVAYESDAYGAERYALHADGTITKMKASELTQKIVDQIDKIYKAPEVPHGNTKPN